MAVDVAHRTVSEILARTLDGERLSDDAAVALLRSRDLVSVGTAADELRGRRTNPDEVTFIVDRNVNYTNVCVTDCDFCAFYREPGDTREGYVLPKPVIFRKIEETLALGGTALLLQGGHNPDLDIVWYEDLFRSIKERYPIHLHALSPPEIQHIARLSKLLDVRRARAAARRGPRLAARRRRRDPRRPRAQDHRAQEDQDGRVARRDARGAPARDLDHGDDDVRHVETLAERIEHLRRLRDLQDETGGFRAFISWTFQPDHTAPRPAGARDAHGVRLPADAGGLAAVPRQLRPHPGSWVTQGLKVGQVALHFGADDMGSIMIEENVVSAAGTTYCASTEDFCRLIRAAGKRPVQRDTLYRRVRAYD